MDTSFRIFLSVEEKNELTGYTWRAYKNFPGTLRKIQTTKKLSFVERRLFNESSIKKQEWTGRLLSIYHPSSPYNYHWRRNKQKIPAFFSLLFCLPFLWLKVHHCTVQSTPSSNYIHHLHSCLVFFVFSMVSQFQLLETDVRRRLIVSDVLWMNSYLYYANFVQLLFCLITISLIGMRSIEKKFSIFTSFYFSTSEILVQMKRQ